jgi:hypothetical protein
MMTRCICALVEAKLKTNEFRVSSFALATSSSVGAVSVASCIHEGLRRYGGPCTGPPST